MADNRLRSVLATDCGSTTTKAILIEYVEEREGGSYRLIARGESPTTVEAPVEDVTVGALNAVTETQEIAGRTLTRDGRILKSSVDGEGADIYISTSSAGGGLQMMVAGVVRAMTAESAERAALGAGAIVMDAVASNDRRLPHEKIEQIRRLRPDMILLSGGVDGGTTSHVAELAELIAAANPTARLGAGYDLPIIYAGNIDARELVTERLGQRMSLEIVDNLRPVLEKENLLPARKMIQSKFLEHVMAHAPGYKTLMEWTDADIMPTPGAVGYMMQTIAEGRGVNIIGVDIGGATTDVFSVFDGVFNRTVSANLGMSYSVSNVLAEAGIDNALRWIPFEVDKRALHNSVKNKMVRPTTIPQTIEDLVIEQAIAREALRLAFEQHKLLATGLHGVQQQRTISEAFTQTATGETLVDMEALDLIVGSGGVLSHAPRRIQSAAMMIDAFQPVGITQLAVDSIFMMPQLGVLAQVDAEAAMDVFERDCLIPLGTVIAPNGEADARSSLHISGTFPDGAALDETIQAGGIRRWELKEGERMKVRCVPKGSFTFGEGREREAEYEAQGGTAGLIVDARGRPMTDVGERLDLYPKRKR